MSVLTREQAERVFDVGVGDTYDDYVRSDDELIKKGYLMRIEDDVMVDPVVYDLYVDVDYEEHSLDKLENVGLYEVEVVINTYKITREYGGPEEGGWYWHRSELVETGISDGLERAEKVREDLQKEYSKKDRGDISSVNGGVVYDVKLERYEGESEQLDSPGFE